MKKVKWGIVGTGGIADKFAHDLGMSEHGELAAVGSRADTTAQIFADKFGCNKCYGTYEGLYNDPEVEAVYIATPHNFHFQNASDALRAGKAVLCEKPLCIDPVESQKLIDVAVVCDQYLMEGMWTYFLPSILKTLEWIKAGLIGDITHIKADFGFKAPYDPKGRLYNPDLAGGAILDIGIYPIALNWLIMQKDPIEIKVMGRRAATGVDLESSFLFGYEYGTSSLACSLSSALPNFAYIIGTEGYIQLPRFWMGDEVMCYKDGALVDQYQAPRSSFGYDYEIDAVCEDIRAGKKQSETMSHASSLKLQEHMHAVLAQL